MLDGSLAPKTSAVALERTRKLTVALAGSLFAIYMKPLNRQVISDRVGH